MSNENEDVRVVLSEKQWEDFIALLEADAEPMPKLDRLLNEVPNGDE